MKLIKNNMEQFNKAEFEKRIENGYFRKKYGLDTSRHSEYWTARMRGKSDLEAQSMIFKRFLKENIMEKKEKYKISDRDYFIDKFRNYVNEEQIKEEDIRLTQEAQSRKDWIKDYAKTKKESFNRTISESLKNISNKDFT
jgi:hypothetical protein